MTTNTTETTDLSISTVDLSYSDDDAGRTRVRVTYGDAHDDRRPIVLSAYFADMEHAPSPDAWLVGDLPDDDIIAAIYRGDTSVDVPAPVQARELSCGWTAVDGAGRRFWPTYPEDIARSPDPEQAVLRAALRGDGTWRG